MLTIVGGRLSPATGVERWWRSPNGRPRAEWPPAAPRCPCCRTGGWCSCLHNGRVAPRAAARCCRCRADRRTPPRRAAPRARTEARRRARRARGRPPGSARCAAAAAATATLRETRRDVIAGRDGAVAAPQDGANLLGFIDAVAAGNDVAAGVDAARGFGQGNVSHSPGCGRTRGRGACPRSVNCSRDPGWSPLLLVTWSEKTSGVAGCADTLVGSAVNVRAAGASKKSATTWLRSCAFITNSRKLDLLHRSAATVGLV